MASIFQFVETIKLPVMNEVAQALISTLNDEDADMITVRDIIAQDPTLTTTMLRMANSAIFGLSRTVTTLDSAVSIIGMSGIRARALAVCISSTFALPPGLDRVRFWRDCMVCAGYARWMALANGLDENQAWLTGMILRLGRLVVVQQDASRLVTLEALPCAPGERWIRQRAVCGFDEGEIMGEVARRWEFPQAIVETLSLCSRADKAVCGARLASVLHLAALLGDHETVQVETLAELPEDVVHHANVNLLWLGMHLPDPELFTDNSLLPS